MKYSSDKDELKKIQQASLLKMIAIAVFVTVAAVFGSVAWFAVNRAVEGAGMQIKAGGDLFNIEALESPAHAGIYDDSALTSYVRDILLSGIEKNNAVITWNVTDDTVAANPDTNQKTLVKGKNIGNAPAEDYEGGISPSSSGMLQFIMNPARSTDAEFTFRFYAFTGGYDDKGDEDNSTIAYIDSNSDTEAILADSLLNGHILLFSNKDSSGRYSGLIASDAQCNRVLKDIYDSKTTVSLYWVWPETLAELLLDDSAETQKNI